MHTKVVAPQRKDKDASLAASSGIKIPQVFSSFEKAWDSVMVDGKTIIARTEHPLELTGLSGINYSHVISPEKVEKHQKEGGLFSAFREFDLGLFTYAVRHWHKDWMHVKSYSKYRNLDIPSYVNELVFSFWEYIRGYNLFVMSDPSVKNRYRIFTYGKMASDGGDLRCSYDLFEGETNLTGGYTPAGVSSRIKDVIAMYESVQEAFGSEVCWVVEMQISESGEIYFLQRSAGKNFTPANWSLSDNTEPCHFKVGPACGWGEVIGTTPQEGIEVDVLLDRSTRLAWLTKDKPSAILSSHLQSSVMEQEEISTVKAFIETYPQSHGDGIRDPHSAIIPMARAPLYLHMPNLHKSFPKDIQDEIDRVQEVKCPKNNMPRERYNNPDYMVRLKLKVVSDGREARVTVLEVC